jgi:hypothetical protein
MSTRKQQLFRPLYLLYHAKQTNWSDVGRWAAWVSENYGMSRPRQIGCIIYNVLRYNISIAEFYQLRFYARTESDKATWAGTGTMYEYHLRMNPSPHRSDLSDKVRFHHVYKPFVRHAHASFAEIRDNPDKAEQLLRGGDKVVLKSTVGQCGRGIVIEPTQSHSASTLLDRLKETKNDLVEHFVEQHPVLAAMSNAGLNTVRIITQINRSGTVDVLGARLRLTVDQPIDNLAAGNIACRIDLETGTVVGPAVYSDPMKAPVDAHPITGVVLHGQPIPFWEETVQLCRDAALHNPANRSVGWDVAITQDGPSLIEGNHDWCKLLWQLPENTGMKPILDAYMRGER